MTLLKVKCCWSDITTFQYNSSSLCNIKANNLYPLFLVLRQFIFALVKYSQMIFNKHIHIMPPSQVLFRSRFGIIQKYFRLSRIEFKAITVLLFKFIFFISMHLFNISVLNTQQHLKSFFLFVIPRVQRRFILFRNITFLL